MLKAYKYRIYPTKEQELYICRTFGCCRFIYNKMLEERIETYSKNKDVKLNNIKYSTPAQYKKSYPFLKEVDSLALCNEQLNLNKAYKNFFVHKCANFPKYKTKKSYYNSFTTNNQDGTIFIHHNYIKIPKLQSLIKIRLHRTFDGLIKSCTISKTSSNKYYISILVDTIIKKLDRVEGKLGIDLGIKNFAICSNGDIFSNPRYLIKSEKKLAKLQKELSRKKKNSNNYNKTRLKIAKTHEKISNQRNDFLHKLSTKIIRENQSIVIENLRVKDMQKDYILSKAILDASWYKFRRMLKYKSDWYGRELFIAPWNYASSQLCSCCDYKNSDVKKLALRSWVCPKCGSTHNRDLNASINLLRLIL